MTWAVQIILHPYHRNPLFTPVFAVSRASAEQRKNLHFLFNILRVLIPTHSTTISYIIEFRHCRYWESVTIDFHNLGGNYLQTLDIAGHDTMQLIYKSTIWYMAGGIAHTILHFTTLLYSKTVQTRVNIHAVQCPPYRRHLAPVRQRV